MCSGTRLAVIMTPLRYVVSSIFHVDANFLFIYLFIKSRPPYQVGKKYHRLVCQRGNLLQDCLPVKFQDVKLKIPSLSMKLDIKHSYNSNYFICNQFFTACCLPKLNSCLCVIFVLYLR